MENITVTSPLLPPLEELEPYLRDIWNKKWLTNNGVYHQKLEQELCKYLGVNYISLFSNGTLALIATMQALELTGEVITSPYSFVATSNAIKLNNLTPVFADVEAETFNIDPDKIEELITENTSAILPVHVYGNPCNHDEIKKIADKYGLKIIYDAAHAFGVKKDGVSVLNYGDLSILSFHATKAYSTIEGGAVICHTQEMKDKLDKLKSFGFDSEFDVSVVGSNAKLNEVQAAFGLVSLKHVDKSILKRKKIASQYRDELSKIRGISFLDSDSNVEHNYSYFPIFVNSEEYGQTRDDLFTRMQEKNIFARKYFYPLITDFSLYKDDSKTYKVASRAASTVICLPLHDSLNPEDVRRVLNVIGNK